jgi:hypothetical protein
MTRFSWGCCDFGVAMMVEDIDASELFGPGCGEAAIPDDDEDGPRTGSTGSWECLRPPSPTRGLLASNCLAPARFERQTLQLTRPERGERGLCVGAHQVSNLLNYPLRQNRVTNPNYLLPPRFHSVATWLPPRCHLVATSLPPKT